MIESPLFEEITIKSLALRNRIVMAPMTRRKSPGGVPGPDVADYYRRRAEGGVGLIITEGTTIDRAAASDHDAIPNIHSPASIEGWRSVVDGVHAAGGKIAAQLWHMGAAPDRRVAEPMTDEDIADTVAAYAKAAAVAKAAGFDAVELHAAHGYLVDQFLWERTNRRSDRYGGDLLRRSAFCAEIVSSMRAAVGADLVISVRLSQWKLQDYDARLANSPSELETLLAPMAEADIFHCSTRRYWQPEFAGSDLNLAGWTKRLTGKPTITVGSIGLDGDDFTQFIRGEAKHARPDGLDALERRLASNEFDLVAVGRALLADPQWPRKVREGRTGEITAFSRDALEHLI